MRLILVMCLVGATLGCQTEPSVSTPAPRALASLLSDSSTTPRGIEAARSFVHGQKEHFTATDLVVAHYLERRFGEKFDIDYATALSHHTKKCAVHKFNAPALGLPSSDELAPNDDYIGRAFQCQSRPLPPGFWDDVNHYTGKAPEGLDNVAIAVQVALEQGCIDNDTHVRQLQALQFEKLKEALAAPKARVDALYLKRFAAWLYTKAGPVDDDWVNRVREAQLDGGGWSSKEASVNPGVGASLLGYWVLLETEADAKPAGVHFVEGKIPTPPPNVPRPYELP